MCKYIKKFFTVFWILVVILSRCIYFFSDGRKMVDVYGLYLRAMVRLEEGAPRLDSGLFFAYTRNLSSILRFTGNRIEAVGIYQMVLQILWLILLFAGISLLFGYVAGATGGSVLAFSPQIMATVFTVWPGNYYMLHFSLVVLLLSYFGYRAEKKGWLANDFGRLCLVAIGFYVGVLCIWSVLGVLLAFVMIYILLRNHFSLKREKSDLKGMVKMRPKAMDSRTKDSRAMGSGTQAIVLTEGILVGIFVTLMKYTGVTGEAIAEQVKWWFSQMKRPFAQYREIEIFFVFWLLGAILAGVLCQFLFYFTQRKKSKMPVQKDDSGKGDDLSVPGYGKGSEKKMMLQGQEGEYIITEDGRRIKLLDNPLPGPKKHVRREMDFDLDFEEEEKDDFDVKIKEDDDFDL